MLITTADALELFGIGHATLESLNVEPEQIDRSSQGRPKKLFESTKLFDAFVSAERKGNNSIFTDDDGKEIDGELEKTLLIHEQLRAQELKNLDFYSTHAPPQYIRCVLKQLVKAMSDELLKGCVEVASIRNIDPKTAAYFTELTADVIQGIERLLKVLPTNEKQEK